MLPRDYPLTRPVVDIDPARDTRKLATDWTAYSRSHHAPAVVARASYRVATLLPVALGLALVAHWVWRLMHV
jgi:hypothetical protein